MSDQLRRCWSERLISHRWGAKAGISRRLWLAGAIASVCVVLIATIVGIPWHMDEFIMYHVLACQHPEQRVNTFQVACDAYPTYVGPVQFQRAYEYVGITSSLILAPFQYLFNSIWTPYAVGVLFLVLTAWGLVKALQIPTRMLLAVLVSFPLTFTVLHDGGPVRVSLLALVWTPVMLGQFMSSSPRARLLWGLTIGTTWAVAAEDKPFFMFLIPGIIAFSLTSLWARGFWPKAKAEWRSLAYVGLAAISLPLLMLLVMQVQGKPYLAFLRERAPDPGAAERLRNAAEGALLTINWPYFGQQRVSDTLGLPSEDSPGPLGVISRQLGFLPGVETPQAIVGTFLNLLLIGVVIGLYVYSGRLLLSSDNSSHRRLVWLLLASAGLLWVGAWLSGGWTSHHYVFAQVPLVGLLLCGATVRAHGFRNLLAVLLVVAALSLAVIRSAPVQPTASPEISRAFSVAEDRADPNSTVINCSSWGCYFPYSLTNARGIPVVFAETPTQAAKLKKIAQGKGLKILDVCMYCTAESVERRYPDSTVVEVPSGTVVWRAFEVVPAR